MSHPIIPMSVVVTYSFAQRTTCGGVQLAFTLNNNKELFGGLAPCTSWYA